MPKKRLVQAIVLLVNILISFFLCKPENYVRHPKNDTVQTNNIVVVATPSTSEAYANISRDTGK